MTTLPLPQIDKNRALAWAGVAVLIIIFFVASFAGYFYAARSAGDRALPSFEWQMPALLMRVPEIEIPDISLPDMRLPEIVFPEMTMPEITMPEFAVPDIQIPVIELSEFKLPEFKLPVIEFPRIEMPQFTWPEISVPKIEMPKIELPKFTWPEIRFPEITLPVIVWPEFSLPEISLPEISLLEISLPSMPMPEVDMAAVLATIGPAAGDAADAVTGAGGDLLQGAEKLASEVFVDQPAFAYPIEQNELVVEGVLVPEKTTVISSSRDGKIAQIAVDEGDVFKKGDVLVEYACKDLEAEFYAAKAKDAVVSQRFEKSMKLLKLDLLSEVELSDAEAEKFKAQAQKVIVEQQREACLIRAAYDGRVTKRLANPDEFTRTDRVLLEVSSLDDLNVEFLMPSRWLRWVNVGAPITLLVSETDLVHEAVIERIDGEVDPGSQSIQVAASLKPYQEPLLPGMSGSVTLNVTAIRKAGIEGYLASPRQVAAAVK